MKLELAGLRALVTGGTRGIGRAIVEALLDEGAQVSFCARSEEGVKAAREELTTAGRAGRVHAAPLDVADEEALTGWVRRSASAMGGLDILVSNVSAASSDWDRLLALDVLSATRMFDAALPALRRSGHASMVAIASRAAYTGDGPYAAMKCALISSMKGLSETHAPEGIRVNTVSPGDIFFAGGVWDEIQRQQPDEWAEALARNRLGRLGRPEEVARVVAFVSSPAASFVSGANIRVDGAGTRSTQF